MKGLLLKDFYNLSRLGKQYILILAVMGVWAYFMKNAGFIVMYVVLCSSMLVMTSFSYDELARFEKYALTMPLEKKTLVQAKYALLFLTVAGGSAVGILLGGLMNLALKGDFMEIVVTGLTVGCLFLFAYSLTLPIIFKMGVEKARMAMVGCYLVIFLLIYGIGKLAGNAEISIGPAWPIAAAIAVSALVIVISYRVSLGIIDKKEW